MRDQWIVDGVPGKVLFTKRDVEATDPNVELAFAIPKARNVFKIEIKFPQLKETARIFPRYEVQFAEEVDIFEDRCFDEQFGFVDTKFRVRVRAVRF